ncbi:glycosyltransferase family 9 protein [Nocardia caishijiensis]|uniref:ADP-heptose:LPS heptosyltransferase n=1 Tax=Nocardia caishijiensis TaxID=184756 RepID=A0ABQ6YM55_9NOCA|nr:glycosyltransferase family 9 protein [Nocardia caishijiensis]KAF0846869.1 ADP-heptose:LPS heptosyltransferase [Nocardia caishijiensis]
MTTVSGESVFGPIAPPFPEVERIVVLRGGGLGDLLLALPAIQALGAAYPSARITLFGSALHAALLRSRPGPVHDVRVLPPPNSPAEDALLDETARERVDLGVQLHGGGAWSNRFLRRTGARWTVGSRADGAIGLTRTTPFRYYQHEMIRALEVVGLAGAAPVTLEPRITVTADDEAAGERLVGSASGPVVTVHPSATDPRRRWPASKFAEVIEHCVRAGADVEVIGANDDRPLLREILDRVGGCDTRRVHCLVDADMTELCGLLTRTTVFVGNDSGPRHLAKALCIPTVGIFWIGNLVNAGPLNRANDRVLTAWTTRCQLCGATLTDEGAPRCEHDNSIVASVTVEDVCREVDELLTAATVVTSLRPERRWRAAISLDATVGDRRR